mmetsp:Transcript_37056/g.56829  ORF Transcript_37056/g.56829 Transcript_37056/m.56829 type:complete len:219 (+) Transcript_37056:3486-4142(+)
MYEHKQDWHSALSVARQYHPESVNKVFLNQAKFYLERRDLAKAEPAFIQAKEPEKAINMYREARMYGEALRVAQKHRPDLIPKLGDQPPSSVENETPEQILNSAKIWEEGRDFHKAIDRYLEITENMLPPDHLVQVWTNCFNLAMDYAKDRVSHVVPLLAGRMIKIQKFDQAAQMFEEANFFEQAIEAYIQNKNWQRALDCARQVRPVELQNKIVFQI